jgi:hypothetical protein
MTGKGYSGKPVRPRRGRRIKSDMFAMPGTLITAIVTLIKVL